MTPASLLGLQL